MGRINQHLIITTNLAFSEWPTVFGVHKMTTALRARISWPHHPILRNRQDRQRQLALQKPQLTAQKTDLALLTPPVGLGPPHAASSAKHAPNIDRSMQRQVGPF
jgi:hypothetical protein